jgi:hypothetical protein
VVKKHEKKTTLETEVVLKRDLIKLHVDWIELAQYNMDKRLTVVSAVMNIWIEVLNN